MYKYLFFFIILLLKSFTVAQSKADYNWFCGYEENLNGQGFNCHHYNFQSKNQLLDYQNIPFGFARSNASISDENGNLLFYTNGRVVLNKNHELMLNGENINAGEWANRFWPNSKYGYPGQQDILILNDPKKRSGYYIFHKTPVYYKVGFDSIEIRMSYIDLSLNNELGEVTIKNKYFYNKKDLLTSYLTAIKHINQKDWWIIQPLAESSEFLTFLLTSDTIIKYPNQNTFQFFDNYRSSASGTAKFSPDGNKYALYNYYDQLHVFSFDRNTGIFSNHKKINVIADDSINREEIIFSSVEWSPNSRFIYTATSDYLHQIDTREEDDAKAIQLIDKYNGTLDPFRTSFFLMVLGPDCRIYVTPVDGSRSIHVIKNPNEVGKACNFVQNGIKLPNDNSGTLPNFPRLRVDEDEKCDPTISSVFGEAVYYRRDLTLYPNPTTGDITVKVPDHTGRAHVVITDIHGQILTKKEIYQTEREQLDMSHLPSGNYNIEIYPVDNKDRIFYGRQVVKL